MTNILSHSAVQHILIAEDHELFGDGIEILLERLFADAQIERAPDFDNAWKLLHNNITFDLMLIDLKMPGTIGFNGVRAIKKSFPGQRLVVMSSLDSASHVEKALKLGVNGFISKSTDKDKMKQAFTDIMQGKIVVEAPRTERVALSQRQMQTLHLMAQGKSNKEIARVLGISANTAKEYVSNVMASLDTENRTQAVQKAEHLGLLFDIE